MQAHYETKSLALRAKQQIHLCSEPLLLSGGFWLPAIALLVHLCDDCLISSFVNVAIFVFSKGFPFWLPKMQHLQGFRIRQ